MPWWQKRIRSIIAVPSAYLKGCLEQLLEKDELRGKTIFSAVKGIVPETNQSWGNTSSSTGACRSPTSV